MRILVTGAAGFTGRYLVPRLRTRGHDVAECNVDLKDSGGLEAAILTAIPDVVVHLAGHSFAASNVVDDYYETNAIGTVRLLNAISTTIESRIRVIIASTANIYRSNISKVLSEDSEVSPSSHYANSKWTMERAASFWESRFDIVFVRPFNYTGIGQSPTFLIPKIVDHFRRGADTISLGSLDVARDFGDVRDVVEAYVGFVEIPGPINGVFNIATGRGTTVREIVSIVEAKAARFINVKVEPALVRVGEPKYLLGSNERLKSLLPHWQSRPLEDTLQWMLDFPFDQSR